MAKQDNYIRYTVRLPAEIYQRIQAHAEANGRSANAEIIALLEMGLFEADWSRIEAGHELPREMNDLEREALEHARASIQRRREAEMIQPQLVDTDLNFLESSIPDQATDAFTALLKSMDERYRLILEEVRAINDRYEADSKAQRQLKK